MAKKKLKRIDIEMTEVIEKLIEEEQEFSGQTKRAIGRTALYEWLKSRSDARKEDSRNEE